jgi:hypothetical protein
MVPRKWNDNFPRHTNMGPFAVHLGSGTMFMFGPWLIMKVYSHYWDFDQMVTWSKTKQAICPLKCIF